MLKLLPLGQNGLNTDIPQWDLPPEFLTDGRNFRITEGHIEQSGGVELWHNLGLQLPLMGKATFIPSIDKIESDIYIGGGASGLIAYDGSTQVVLKLIDPQMTDVYGWTFCRMGAYLIANHPEEGAFYWYPHLLSTSVAHALPFEKTNQSGGDARIWNTATLLKSGKIIRSHKNFLFMLNLKEEINGVMENLPDSFRWSHPANINEVPVTWNEADQFFMAGIASLGTDSGYIVDGLTLRDTFVIYSSNGINRLDSSGDEFVWRRSTLTTTANLLSKDCVVECKGNHFFLANGDIVVNDGNNIDSIVHNRIKKHLNANISTTKYGNSYAVRNDIQKEIWFCVPQDGSDSASIAYIYNWKDDTWAIRDLPTDTVYAVYGTVNNRGSMSWKDYDTKQSVWSSTTDVWGSSSLSPFNNTIIGNTLSGKLDNIDDVSSSTDSNMFIERQNFPLEGHRQVTTLVRAYPHISGSTVRIRFGAHDHANAPVRWYPNWTVFDPRKDRKIDFRVTGKLIAWRIESIGSNKFQYSGMDIEYALTGQR